MKLEQQIVSLELAKRMMELGFKQESYFWWVQWIDHTKTIESDLSLEQRKSIKGFRDFVKLGSAYTVAELGEMLPSQLTTNLVEGHNLHQLILEKQATRWHAVYICVDCMGKMGGQIDESLPNAMARMLIYLKENGLLAPTSGV